MAQRAAIGLALAVVVAGAAWRAGALSRSGVLAAAGCGTACVIAGWSWAALLILYFVAAALLSRAGSDQKDAITRGIVSKGGARDATQVLANGGLYSLAALIAAGFGIPWLAWGAVGALAASSADSWATELGVWLGGEPRSIISWTYVRPGESGGVTLTGLVASGAGAAWVGVVAMVLGLPATLGLTALLAGFGGSITDSVLGATLQERFRCDACNEPTERAIHVCGSATRRVGGIRWLDNDVINLLATCAGLFLGVLFYWIAENVGTRWNPIG